MFWQGAPFIYNSDNVLACVSSGVGCKRVFIVVVMLCLGLLSVVQGVFVKCGGYTCLGQGSLALCGLPGLGVCVWLSLLISFSLVE